MVDFPDPEGPTTAMTFGLFVNSTSKQQTQDRKIKKGYKPVPGSTVSDILLKMGEWGLAG